MLTNEARTRIDYLADQLLVCAEHFRAAGDDIAAALFEKLEEIALTALYADDAPCRAYRSVEPAA